MDCRYPQSTGIPPCCAEKLTRSASVCGRVNLLSQSRAPDFSGRLGKDRSIPTVVARYVDACPRRDQQLASLIGRLRGQSLAPESERYFASVRVRNEQKKTAAVPSQLSGPRWRRDPVGPMPLRRRRLPGKDFSPLGPCSEVVYTGLWVCRSYATTVRREYNPSDIGLGGHGPWLGRFAGSVALVAAMLAESEGGRMVVASVVRSTSAGVELSGRRQWRFAPSSLRVPNHSDCRHHHSSSKGAGRSTPERWSSAMRSQVRSCTPEQGRFKGGSK